MYAVCFGLCLGHHQAYHSVFCVDQKLAACRYFSNRIDKHPLENTEKKIHIVKNIERNNQYNITFINITSSGKKNKEKGKEEEKCVDNTKSKWVTFTYYGKARKHITKLFTGTNARIAYEISM
jgi:hypothetical protein